MRRWGSLLVVAAALTLLVGRWASMVYANWQWYDAMGALPVYRSQLLHETAWRGGAGLVAFAFAFLNLYALRRSIISLVLPRRLGNIEIGEAIPGPMLLAVVFIASAVIAGLLSTPAGDWTTFAFARIAGPFREMDPYLDRDISYVVAWLPFELELRDWATVVVVVMSAIIVTLYALTPSLRLRRGGLYVSAYCRRHLATLAAIGLLLLAWNARLDGVSMTSLGTDTGHPFGPYEYRAGIALMSWISILTGVAAFLVFWAGWHGYARVASLAGITACLGGPMLAVAVPSLGRRSVTPAEQREQDRPFAATRRLFTRRAFGVDAIAFAGTSPRPSSPASIANGLPSWDPAAMLMLRGAPGASAGRLRADLAWSTVPSLQAIVVMAPHAGESTRWTGERIEPATTDERGRLQSALPPPPPAPATLAWDDLLVSKGATGFSVFADTTGHIPAPRFESFVQRLAHAWNLRSPRLLANPQPTVRPRIAFRRDVRERISALVPFLTVGPTIAPFVRGDTLYWCAELFSTATAYPLSERLMFSGAPRAYVHHAGTALVNAETGRVLLVRAPDADAIARTWMRRFPRLFAPPSEFPDELLALRQPAVDWIAVQATALARTGIGPSLDSPHSSVGVDNADADLTDAPATFYAARASGGPLSWSIPLVGTSGTVSGVLIGNGGGYERTEWQPATRTDKWSEVLDRLQRTADSAGFGRQRRNARRGRVMVIPISGGLFYSQAHYEWPGETAPALVGVTTEFNGVPASGLTVGEAIGGPSRRPISGQAALHARVAALHRRMNDALRRGDWAAFGAAFEAMGRLIKP